MIPRQCNRHRKTHETEITVSINLDGTGKHNIDTDLPFLNHMLETLAVHGNFDIAIICDGDLDVSPHHSVEDVALVLGNAFDTALNMDAPEQLTRYANTYIPMDDALAHAVIDTERPYFTIDATYTQDYINTISAQLFSHFFRSFAHAADITLHATVTGHNTHHQVEALFKATAHALDTATTRTTSTYTTK